MSRGRRGGAQPGNRPRRLQAVGGTYNLGDLTADTEERPPLEAAFGYFGEQIRVNPDLTEVDMIDFLDDANRVNANDPQSMLMVKEAARTHVHPDDFDRFWALRKQHRQGVESLMATIWQIVSAVTARPTGRASDSSDGPPVISQNLPPTASPPAGGSNPDDELRNRYLRQIDRFERQGPAGVAVAAQIATAAEAKGINVTRDDAAMFGPSVHATG